MQPRVANPDWSIGELVDAALNGLTPGQQRCKMDQFTGIDGGKQRREKMGIYDPLRDHLRRKTTRKFELTFSEICNIVGRQLPKSAERPQWWANQKDDNRPQRDAWRDAGYEAFLIKSRDRVRFVKVA
jgi:hypothetical protein